MSLRKAQTAFAFALAVLLTRARLMGYEVTLGDAWSVPCPNCGHYGHKKKSKHKDRLAIDLNLFVNGDYLDKTEDHRPLGEFWEKLGGIWGGRFDDGNHYEWPIGIAI